VLVRVLVFAEVVEHVLVLDIKNENEDGHEHEALLVQDSRRGAIP
jgi:hypothetical protein